MRGPWKLLVVVLAIPASGALRLFPEAALESRMREERLLPGRLDTATRERIGQTGAAVALGGLRTLVASFLNLRAYTFFTNRKWDDLAKTFDMMVDLAPRTVLYWDMGSWHLAYNAASYYAHEESLPPMRRRQLWRQSVLAGRTFLERGIRNNPDDWNLPDRLGFLLSDRNRNAAFPDVDASFAAAVDAYDKALAAGAPSRAARSRIYALARIPGRRAEALAEVERLAAQDPRRVPPTMLCLLFVLRGGGDAAADPLGRAVAVFGSPERAHEHLGNFRIRVAERFPQDGVPAAIEALEQHLGIPEERSVLRHRPVLPAVPGQ
jgi:hypothetical protein